MSYVTRVGAWLSQGLNCIFFNGSPDQTISARAYLNRNNKYWYLAYLGINALFFWQENHCKESHQADINFAHQVLGLK